MGNNAQNENVPARTDFPWKFKQADPPLSFFPVKKQQYIILLPSETSLKHTRTLAHAPKLTCRKRVVVSSNLSLVWACQPSL